MAIKLENITKGFQEHVVISDVSMEVAEGELFVLLGSSGSGKSTILRLIAGLAAPDSGRIYLKDRDVTALPPHERGTGFVFQNYAIFKHMTVGENVEFGLRIRKVPAADRRKRRDEMLELVGLSGLASRMPSQLSGGQRQRVALARALAYRPTVLLLDEPFGALDVKIRSQLRNMLRDVQHELRVTSILVTHDQEEAFELGDRIGILDRGQLVEIGGPEDLYHRPRSESAATFLGSGNVVVGRNEGGMIRMGAHVFPFPAGAPEHDEGAPVRVLFRPEAVEISDRQFSREEVQFSLGEATLQERNFGGPVDRLRFEVKSLQGSRPVKPSLQYGHRYPVVDVIGKSVVTANCKTGQNYHLGIKQFHVLHPSGIRMLVFCDRDDAESAAVRVADVLIAASHGPATFFSIVPDSESRDLVNQKLKAAVAALGDADGSQIDVLVRTGQITRELVREVQAHFYDFVIFGGKSFADSEVPVFEPVVRRLLVYSRIPVLISSTAPAAFKKILICTAAGEPGKGDVRLGARIARHAGSVSTIFHALAENASEEWRASVTKHLAQAQALLEAYGISAEVQLARGAWQAALLEKASSGDYDLVVLGTSGSVNYGVADFGLEVVRRTGKAVLLVPPGEGIG